MANAALVGLSSQIVLRRELSTLANNIANLNTTGYKKDSTVFHQYVSDVARETHFGSADQRVRFVHDRANWRDFSPGPLQRTGNPLDVAIDGDAFLVVQTERGERYTRNGALQIDAQGRLVTHDGAPVMGDNGPILFQPLDRSIAIAEDGRVTVIEGANSTVESQRGRIRLVAFEQPQQLLKDGASTFHPPEGLAPEEAPNARLVQGAVEQSNVNGIVEMTRMIDVARAYGRIGKLLQQHGELRRSAIEKLAEVPA